MYFSAVYLIIKLGETSYNLVIVTYLIIYIRKLEATCWENNLLNRNDTCGYAIVAVNNNLFNQI